MRCLERAYDSDNNCCGLQIQKLCGGLIVRLAKLDTRSRQPQTVSMSCHTPPRYVSLKSSLEASALKMLKTATNAPFLYTMRSTTIPLTKCSTSDIRHVSNQQVFARPPLERSISRAPQHLGDKGRSLQALPFPDEAPVEVHLGSMGTDSAVCLVCLGIEAIIVLGHANLTRCLIKQVCT